MKKSFMIYKDSLAVLDDLNDQQCGELFRAIKAHQLDEEFTLSPIVKIAFSSFKGQFFRDDEKYKKTCEARAAAGSMGGKQKVANLANASKSKQTVANVADSDKESDKDKESDSNKTLDQSALDLDSDCIEFCFDNFWKSGIRKVNKKKTKSLFNNLLKKQDTRDNQRKFTGRLITDIQKRLNSNQLGFAEMHPTTYLNGERWNDEVTTHEENRSNGYPSANKLTPTERVQAKRAEAARRRCTVEPMGNDDQVISPRMDEQGGGGTDRPLGEIINGTFSRSD